MIALPRTMYGSMWMVVSFFHDAGPTQTVRRPVERESVEALPALRRRIARYANLGLANPVNRGPSESDRRSRSDVKCLSRTMPSPTGAGPAGPAPLAPARSGIDR